MDINVTDSSSIFLGIVNWRHVYKYTFHELRPDFNNHSKLSCSTHCIFDQCSIIKKLGNWFALVIYGKPMWNSDILVRLQIID